MNFQEAQAAFRSDAWLREDHGIIIPDASAYVPDGWGRNVKIAMDALPTLAGVANSAIPALFTTIVDPKAYEILWSPNKAAQILGEARKGDWTMDTAIFPTVEHTGEVSSYGDFAVTGQAGANVNFPNRQSYHFQTTVTYGDREMERAGLAKINWVSELDTAANTVLAKYLNLSYLYGITGLQCYGLLNDPNLTAALTPAVKAAGGVTWFVNNTPNATPNEVYNDFLAIFEQLVAQTQGLISREDKIVVALSPATAVALGFVNSFGLVVRSMLKDEFPNMRFETAVQYGTRSTTNPQGVVGGNLIQMMAETIEGQDTGYCSFTEKLRSFPVVRELSSYKKKLMSGTWGAVIRQPFAIAQMLGI